MAKSKKQTDASQTNAKQTNAKQTAAKQTHGTGDEFGRTIEYVFSDHPWPASRTELIEHASRQGTLAKADLMRLKRIPHRDYHSVADLVDATRMADVPMGQGPGPVATAEHNRRAMSDTAAETHMQPAAPYDQQTH